jgi:hypothetical protein
MNHEPLTITRRTTPTKQDTAEYQTHCIVHDNPDVVWIQMSHDEENPNWIAFVKEK